MESRLFSILDTDALKVSTETCILCETCVETCCTAGPTGDEKMTPMGRLQIIGALLSGETPDTESVRALYYCTECGRCDTVCPMDIPVSGTIADAKVVLVSRGLGPLEKHESMIRGILKNRNAVNKPAEERLAWIPEAYRDQVAFDDAPSDTVLYVGCLSSFVDKQTAAASLEILMQGGVDFKLLSDEYCCGIYPYNAGKWDEALAIFTEMQEMFKAFGIRRMIVPCAGCHRCFSAYYPRLLPDFDVEILHITEVIGDLVREDKLAFKPGGDTVTVHDACKTGRKWGQYERAREILSAMDLTVAELAENRESALCCGSGSGVRSLDAKLSMQIAGKVLDNVTAPDLVSTCPFCIFNFNYTAKKTEKPVKARHIASLVRARLV
ncbi:MAG: hypothetical protein CSA22_05700 [Deltaproteobacteria bacterium]|nr:MAG: hypothetical protein CSA22_05700 [Deltaproteobacteria bacterium]